VLSGCVGGLRSAPWKAGDTLRICPTTNGVASARICPAPQGEERPRLHGLRAILDAVFYVLKSGCPWRLLPRDFPPWKTIYDWFRKWRIDERWERLKPSCESVYGGNFLAETRTPAQALWTPSQSGPREWEATSAASILARRSKGESAICWWTPTGWCSVHKSMPQACTTETVGRGFSTTSWPRSCPG
jgi:transposase